MHDQAVRWAQWFLDQGIQPGDLVAMYMKNSPEFIIVWFAMLCIGAAPAFINYNLEGNALLHCLGVARTKLILVDDDPTFLRRINASRQGIEEKGTKIVLLDQALNQEVTARKATDPGDEFRGGVTGEFPYCLIYTRSVRILGNVRFFADANSQWHDRSAERLRFHNVPCSFTRLEVWWFLRL